MVASTHVRRVGTGGFVGETRMMTGGEVLEMMISMDGDLMMTTEEKLTTMIEEEEDLEEMMRYPIHENQHQDQTWDPGPGTGFLPARELS